MTVSPGMEGSAAWLVARLSFLRSKSCRLVSALAVSVWIQSTVEVISCFGGGGDFVMVRSNPTDVKVLHGLSGMLGVNDMSIGRARTSVTRCNLGSTTMVENGCVICAMTSAGGRAVESCLVMMLWALPLWLLGQLNMWSP